MTAVDDAPVPNINIGILGHVDSGKTSLARALSSTASTAAFDKSPESQRRGITLDLGFSACFVSTCTTATHLFAVGIAVVQCTFVDCPGHASLIRTILGGAQIIDIMVLVIDACKGIQTQTAECMVIGEVLCKPIVVVINKIDAVQGQTAAEKRAALDKLRNRIQKTFQRTRWPVVPIVEVSASPRGGTVGEGGSEVAPPEPINVKEVLSAVLALVNASALIQQLKAPLSSEDFVMMVDHCFALRGQGTVFTGTVLRGRVSVGDSILIPSSQDVKKVKGLQVFHKPVQQARRGDRVGLSVAQFDAGEMERGIVCSVHYHKSRTGHTSAIAHPFQSSSVFIAEVSRVRFHQLPCNQHTKFHITIGHSTVMGTMRYFSRPTVHNGNETGVYEDEKEPFDLLQESQYVEELGEDACFVFDSPDDDSTATRESYAPGQPLAVKRGPFTYYAVVLLEKSVLISVGTPFVATRLDVERENMCRIAIAGLVRALLPGAGDPAGQSWRTLPVVRYKSRSLVVERVVSDRICIASGVVSCEAPGSVNGHDGSKGCKEGAGVSSRAKDTLHAEVQKFVGLRVFFRPAGCDESSNAHSGHADVVEGTIDSAFGKTGKVKLVFKEPLFSVTTDAHGPGRSRRGGAAFLRDGVIELTLKKYPLATFSHIKQ
ncbi:Elongation factor Tu GTP binding domain [Trypanosoma vivax]|uniref:Putative selenocysteine-tRNA-specific elongation factor n=1 Tax=Trypanosoma vivax (strain Y486) TaxID=1055687 RepID=G0TU53_TRYVY|nr:Elongation factor Tu GTP binding domain [Trypanosoma vivax]KAH8620928.1 Elongation factor Tu GTP binding domain [Trypanosoma vivax]CCC47487.1 putative selenocysteine-tRNA-specific elongation factor [Trypanosoma vivax Y486]